MATVKVTFPDGSIQDVPARKRVVESRQLQISSARVQLEPVPNLQWRFKSEIGGWRAEPRS